MGDLPSQLAAMIMTNVNIQQLTVEAALTGKGEHIYHAAMNEPHTAAELSIDEIWSMISLKLMEQCYLPFNDHLFRNC